MFLDSIINLEDTPYATLRIITIVATLLKTMPNSYILLSFAGMFLPASFQAAFLSFFTLTPIINLLKQLPIKFVLNSLNRINPLNLN